MTKNHIDHLKYPWGEGIGFGLGFSVVTDYEKTELLDNNGTYDDWKQGFDDLADKRAEFSRKAKVGKVDDNTAIVVVDVFDPAGMMAMFNSDAAKKMAEEMGVVRTPYKLQAMG